MGQLKIHPWTVGVEPWAARGPLVTLPEDAWGIIIECKSGIWFHAQCGGNACLQVCAEGVFVPLDAYHDEAEALRKHCESGGCRRPMTEADAAFIDELLTRNPSLRDATVKVDRLKLAFSTEAWVRITIDSLPERFPSPYGFLHLLGVSSERIAMMTPAEISILLEQTRNSAEFSAAVQKDLEMQISAPSKWSFAYGLSQSSGILVWPNTD